MSEKKPPANNHPATVAESAETPLFATSRTNIVEHLRMLKGIEAPPASGGKRPKGKRS